MDRQSREDDVVTTVRVVNVPSHTTETEFNCWFIFAEGFEQAQLKATRGYGVSQIGWARFNSVEAAHAAIEKLNQLQLSEDQSPEGITLTADMAKGNFRPNPGAKKRQRDEVPIAQYAPVAMQPVAYTVPPPVQYNTTAAWSAAPRQGAPSGRGTTLLVGGLLAHCSEEELYDFFGSRFHGFEKLKFMPSSGSKPGLCFVKFETHEHAQATFAAINEGGDALPSNPSVALRPEWAKNDLDAPRQDAGGGGQYYPPAPHYVQAPAPPPPPRQQVWAAAPAAKHNPQALSATPPGDTMFIGGLAQHVQEEELHSALSGFAGFLRLKMSGKANLPTAFALFDSVHSCQTALRSLHGMALSSSPQQPLNCEFARNSLDKRSRN